MAKDWEYAVVSQQMAAGGGPIAWIETIKKNAYNKGATDMRIKITAPLLVVGTGIGTIGTISFQRIKKWILDKKQQKIILNCEAEVAEKLLSKEVGVTVEEFNEENIRKD